MAHFKRRRAKKQRSGCLWCKPHKCNGVGADKRTARDRRLLALGARAGAGAE